ncbi:V-type ATP synthase subunit I [Candidatus Woesearchaeota archaeon]|nr:V-type ATP synthase subunit I [Candidatus Woesearchaeota archaeon]
MLIPDAMNRVLIAGPKKMQKSVIRELHKLKIIHIVEHSRNELADIGAPLENAGKLSEILVKVRALIAEMNLKKEDDFISNRPMQELSEVEAEVNKLNEEIRAKSEEIKKIEELTAKETAIRQELEILKDVNINLEDIANYKTLAYFHGHLRDESKLLALKNELQKATKKFMILDAEAKGKRFVILFVDVKHKDHANLILSKLDFAAVNFVYISSLSGNASANLKETEKRLLVYETEKKRIAEQINLLGQKNKSMLWSYEKFLGGELEKAEAPLKFAATKSTFLIKGWIPKNELNLAAEKLKQATNDTLFIHYEDAKKNDKVPIKLNNPRSIKPFEFFLDMYTMPTHKEFDPTFFLFLTFPLLFGFMLGDFGYGIVTLITFILLKGFIPKARNFFNILIFASVATIFFGLLFGEFFGYEHIGSFELPQILSRSHQIQQLMYLAVAVGILHINLGLVIGFFNELKSHGLMHAVFAKLGWIVLQIGIALLALSYFNFLSIPLYVGIIFFVLSLIMLFKGEGIKGLIELPGIFSNTLSYARLMAIGLSSVKLAEVINESAGEMFHGNIFLILTGVLLLVIGHIINIGLGIMGSFLHSLRLHYVEFFTKFFEGGAKKYAPFGENK